MKLGRTPLKVTLAASSWSTNCVSGSTRSVRNRNGLDSSLASPGCSVGGAEDGLPVAAGWLDVAGEAAGFVSPTLPVAGAGALGAASLGTIRPLISRSLTSHSATSPAARYCLNWL